jgi:hypothetical protein
MFRRRVGARSWFRAVRRLGVLRRSGCLGTMRVLGGLGRLLRVGSVRRVRGRRVGIGLGRRFPTSRQRRFLGLGCSWVVLLVGWADISRCVQLGGTLLVVEVVGCLVYLVLVRQLGRGGSEWT